MKVLVNARFYGLPFCEARFRYLLDQLVQISNALSISSISILTDLTEAELLVSENKERFNCHLSVDFIRVSKPGLGGFLSWYELKIPRLVKKLQADILIHGDEFCSLSVKIPQFMVADGILLSSFRKMPALDRAFLKKRWPKVITKASGILFWNQGYSEKLADTFPKQISKYISGEMNPLASIRCYSWEEKQEVLHHHTQGLEFFTAVVGGKDSAQSFLDILKGYSWFKKRFHSNMKLMVFGAYAQNWLKTIPLESYKYRQEVILCESKYFLQLLPASYALAYSPSDEHFPLAILEAFQSGVPVIAAKDHISAEIAGDANAFKDETDPEQWGRLFGDLYKDEAFRKTLINRGFELTEKREGRLQNRPKSHFSWFLKG